MTSQASPLIPAAAALLIMEIFMGTDCLLSVDSVDGDIVAAHADLDNGWHLDVHMFCASDMIYATFAKEEIRRSVYINRSTELDMSADAKICKAIVNKRKRLAA